MTVSACSLVSPSLASATPLDHRQQHPWPTGSLFESPGAHLTYRVIGPCCRLYDREQLPWPCCRIQWRSKEPSWRRIGRRLVVDLASRRHPSYCVEIVGQNYRSEPIVMTLYTAKLSGELQNWWHSKRLDGKEPTLLNSPLPASPLPTSPLPASPSSAESPSPMGLVSVTA